MGSREFCRACSSAWLERPPDKREVGGSSPPRPTIDRLGPPRFRLAAVGSREGSFPASRVRVGAESEDWTWIRLLTLRPVGFV